MQAKDETKRRWYVVWGDNNVSVTWAKSEEAAAAKTPGCERVYPAPSQLDEIRPLKENLERNAKIGETP